MNLLVSHTVAEDLQFSSEGHFFLGAADGADGEVHIFLKKDDKFAPEYYIKMQQMTESKKTAAL